MRQLSVTMQNYLNLLYREEEREMIPLCRDQGVGLMPWSPMARGRLTRPASQTSRRSETDAFGQSLYRGTEEADAAVIEAVGRLANALDVPMAQVALAWVLAKAGVSAPIIGASSPGHVDDAVASLGIRLTDEQIMAIEGPYLPHPVAGFE